MIAYVEMLASFVKVGPFRYVFGHSNYFAERNVNFASARYLAIADLNFANIFLNDRLLFFSFDFVLVEIWNVDFNRFNLYFDIILL